MGKKTTPEDFARWERERRELYARFVTRWQAAYERDERRRRRLRRMTFGFAGRHPAVPPPPGA